MHIHPFPSKIQKDDVIIIERANIGDGRYPSLRIDLSATFSELDDSLSVIVKGSAVERGSFCDVLCNPYEKTVQVINILYSLQSDKSQMKERLGRKISTYATLIEAIHAKYSDHLYTVARIFGNFIDKYGTNMKRYCTSMNL